jgi:hypothetical protein
MIFQTLDNKQDCIGIYTNGKLIFDDAEFPDDLTQTWKPATYLKGRDVEYASLYLEGKALRETLPEYLLDDWEDVRTRLASFHRSLSLAQVDQTENCFFDLVPDRFLVDYCEVKNNITSYIFRTQPRPARYAFYECVSFLLEEIRHRPVVVDHRLLKSLEKNDKLQSQCRSIASGSSRVNYKQFGTVTGRLTTHPGSFPILTLNKSLRSAILPTNDYFVEIDFNGAEVRTLLGLLKEPQPTEDVHQFHLDNIFSDLATRNEAKVAFFAWLYGSSRINPTTKRKLESFYSKDKLLGSYWDGSTVTTPYGKIIRDTSAHHALNYLVQSTAAELTLKQSLKIDHVLSHHSQGSHLAFVIHDAVVLDLKKEDLSLLTPLSKMMSSTNFGEFRINVKKGTTLGNMKDYNVG